MATSRRDPPISRGRTIRTAPSPKPTEPSSGPGRRARSVPSSPDRKFTSSSTFSSSGGYRHLPSVAGRRASLPSTSNSTISSTHSNRAATKPATSSLRPPTLTETPSASFKDMTRTAMFLTTLQKSKKAPKPYAQKAAVAAQKSSTQMGAPGTVISGRAPAAVLSACAPSSTTKKIRETTNDMAASSRPTSVLEVPKEAYSTMDKEEDLSLQFDEAESISSSSIEEHLHERLPDPVELKPMDGVANSTPEQDHREPSPDQVLADAAIVEEERNNKEDKAVVSKEEQEVEEGIEDLKEAQVADGSARSEADVPEQAEKVTATENEADKAKAEKTTMPMKRPEVVQGWRKDDPRSNVVIEETKSKLLEERKSRVKALVGAFETVMSSKKEADSE